MFMLSEFHVVRTKKTLGAMLQGPFSAFMLTMQNLTLIGRVYIVLVASTV